MPPRHHPAALVAAFSVATVLSGVAGGLIMQLRDAAWAAVIVAGLHTLFLAIPAYAVLSTRMPVSPLRASLTGFIIGAAPILLLLLLVTPQSASIGNVETARNGIPTLAGLGWNLASAAGMGMLGAVGGLAFWAVLAFTRRAPPETVGSAGTRSPGVRAARTAAVMFGTSALAVGAIALSAVPRDLSCHNVFRNGGRSVESRLNADLDVGPADWSEVRQAVRAFAGERGWSYREVRGGDPATYLAMDLSICVEPGTVIAVSQHYIPHERDDSAMPRELSRMHVSVMQPQGGDSWREPSAAFLDRLKARWGDRLTLQDDRGGDIQWPAPSKPESDR